MTDVPGTCRGNCFYTSASKQPEPKGEACIPASRFIRMRNAERIIRCIVRKAAVPNVVAFPIRRSFGRRPKA